MEEEIEINNRTVRFSEADWFKPGNVVVVGGAGGISSSLAFLLGRLECAIYIYDFDEVDETNMASQFFRTQDIGKAKTQAISEIIYEFSENSNVNQMGRFEEGGSVGPITIAGFDNMKARKMMFEAWCALENKQLFIDGRSN